MKLSLMKMFGLFLILSLCSFWIPSKLINEKYKTGYYTDSSGKVEGYIYFTYDNYEKFKFKEELTGKKKVKRVSDCTGFFVDDKTFRVIEKIDLKIGIWNVFAEKAFAEVVLEGKMNLYRVYSMVGNANMRAPGSIDVVNYILEKNGTKSYVLASPQKGKFKTALSELFSDREDIVEKIKNGTYKLDNIIDLVKDYNSAPGLSS